LYGLTNLALSRNLPALVSELEQIGIAPAPQAPANPKKPSAPKEHQGLTTPNAEEEHCSAIDRAKFTFRWDSATQTMRAVVTPATGCGKSIVSCPNPNSQAKASDDCSVGIPLLTLRRGIVTSDIAVDLPIEAAMRNYEYLVTAGAGERLIQCNTSQRVGDDEKNLCKRTNIIERRFNEAIAASTVSTLRSINGAFQFVTVWTGVLLVMWYGSRTKWFLDVDRAVRGSTMKLPWAGAETIEDAYNEWKTFVSTEMRGSPLHGAAIAEASPWLSAQGAAIVACRTGQDARQAVSQAIEAHANLQEAAGGLGKYLIYAIPSLGFLGTVWGLRAAMALTAPAQSGYPPTAAWAKAALGDQVVIAFDTTMFALIASLIGLLVIYLAGQLAESATERVKSDMERELSSGAMSLWVTSKALPRAHGDTTSTTLTSKPPMRGPASGAIAVVLLLLALIIGGMYLYGTEISQLISRLIDSPH
jgi:biopolymer transport protein ExbB/TolQ